jgi:hypothetical protein
MSMNRDEVMIADQHLIVSPSDLFYCYCCSHCDPFDVMRTPAIKNHMIVSEIWKWTLMICSEAFYQIQCGTLSITPRQRLKDATQDIMVAKAG